jgi:hypothetical protein
MISKSGRCSGEVSFEIMRLANRWRPKPSLTYSDRVIAFRMLLLLWPR